MYVEREKTAVVNKNTKKEENRRFSTAVLLEGSTKKIRGTELPIPLNCFYLRLHRNAQPDQSDSVANITYSKASSSFITPARSLPFFLSTITLTSMPTLPVTPLRGTVT